MTDLTVIVPSYCRPDDLRRCLEALCDQRLAPAQVVVVVRDLDEPTHMVAHAFVGRLPLELVIVSEPGQVHALNAGLLRVKGEIVAITDDDAAPRSDWLARIAAHFAADPQIGGVGGRDWVHTSTGAVIAGQQRVVGRVQWFGRIVGNHHIGAGSARDADILKGANMSFRRAAIEGLRFDARLRGLGAQVHNDMCFSLAVKRRGWKLIYDSAVAVDHYPALRLDVDQRGVFHPEATANAAFNMMWATQTQLTGWRRWMSRQWQIWIEVGGKLSWARVFRGWLRGDRHVREQQESARQGRQAALLQLNGDEHEKAIRNVEKKN